MPFLNSIEEIDVKWLQRHYQEAGLHEGIISMKVQAVGNGNLSQVYRLVLSSESDPLLHSPSSVLLKCQAASVVARRNGVAGYGFQDRPGFYEAEHIFYRDIAWRSSIRTPSVFSNVISANRQCFCLLLEDVTDAIQLSDMHRPDEAQISLALGEIAKLHGETSGRRTTSEFRALGIRSRGDAERLLKRLEDAMPMLRSRYFNNLDPKCEAVCEMFLAHAVEWYLDHRWGESIIHGDYRLDNLLFTAGGECVVVDWQVTSQGPPGWDVGYLLAMALGPGRMQDQSTKLLTIYHDAVIANGAALTRDQVWNGARAGFYLLLMMGMLGARWVPPDGYGSALVKRMLESACAAILETRAHEVLH